LARLDYILRLVASRGAVGFRIKAGIQPSLLYPQGEEPMAMPAFSERQLRDFVREIARTDDLAELSTSGRATMHYEYERRIFACDLRGGRGGLEAEFRVVPPETATEEEAPKPKTGLQRASGGRHRDLLPPEDESLPEIPPIEPPSVATEWVAMGSVFDDDETGGPPAADGLPRGPGMDLRPAPAPPPAVVHTPPPLSAGSGVGELRAPSAPTPPASPPTIQFRPEPPPSTPGGLRPAASIHYTRSEATMPPEIGGRLNREEFHKLLRWMVEQEATDLHVTPRYPPTLRVDNLFQPSQGRQMSPEEIEKVILSILSPLERAALDKAMGLDLSYEVEGLGRFRINVFRQLHGISAAIRYVRSTIEGMEKLRLPKELLGITEEDVGLVLFTGPTGSGKSTTMASIIEHMNRTKQKHILTLEQPVEFLFKSQNCLIQQREVGMHTPSFLDGLRDAMRENPDVIMVGELRDLETVQMAISAAETGHLILATMHANTSTNAVSRLIDVFPDTQKAGARTMLSDVLTAVVNLRLVRHKSGRGLLPAVEFLRNTHAVGTMIRENKLYQLPQVLTTAMSDGMWCFERYLVDLFRKGEIDYATAYGTSPDKRVFESLLGSNEPSKEGAARRKRPVGPTPP
jgi:twitching motility protein PilT